MGGRRISRMTRRSGGANRYAVAFVASARPSDIPANGAFRRAAK
jgi:hypothetical protein